VGTTGSDEGLLSARGVQTRSDTAEATEAVPVPTVATMVPISGYGTRARTSGQVQWGALINRQRRRELTPPRLRSPSPSGTSDKQSDESELSAQEGSFADEQEHELDVRESAQRILGEQRLIESSCPPAPPKETRPQRVLPEWKATIVQYRKQLEDAKEKERKLQELLRTRERDITQLRSLRTDTFEGPSTFYEETILRLNNQLQMLRRDTSDHNEEKKLMEGRERGHAEVMKEIRKV
jgi:hypothetical protein